MKKLDDWEKPSQREKEWSEELLEIERKKLEFKRRKMEREVKENDRV